MFMSQNTIRFAEVIGSGALRFWPDLPREIQKCLFEKAVLMSTHWRFACTTIVLARPIRPGR